MEQLDLGIDADGLGLHVGACAVAVGVEGRVVGVGFLLVQVWCRIAVVGWLLMTDVGWIYEW